MGLLYPLPFTATANATTNTAAAIITISNIFAANSFSKSPCLNDWVPLSGEMLNVPS
jgi:hypothetical protein